MPTFAQLHPFPPIEGTTRYTVTALYCGCRVQTTVVGLPRLRWTVLHFAELRYDDIRWKEVGQSKKQGQSAAEKVALFSS